MTVHLFPALLSTWFSLGTGAAPSPDPWLSEDKARHFAVTTALSGGGYGVAALYTDKRWLRLAVGFGSALAVGAAKEGYDALGQGDPSWKDMTWNVLGAATGTLIAWGIDHLVFGDHARPSEVNKPLAAF